MSSSVVPPYHEFLWPTLQTVRKLGGSASNEEIFDSIVVEGNYTTEQVDALHNDGPQTEIAYRLAWARTYLKGMGLLNNSQRGVWSLTDYGRVVNEHELPALRQQWLLEMRRARKAKPQPNSTAADADGADDPGAGETEWRETLLDTLMNMSPDAFERLSQRLLREAGFVNATVTGRTGDGGIDGVGVYRLSLLSFPVFFQCKRYRGSVGSSVVRDFRGAMAGRGDKGILITTGTYTKDAKFESTRDGAPPVDLIDGHRLCDLLKEYGLGVITNTRQVEDVTVKRDFFTSI